MIYFSYKSVEYTKNESVITFKGEKKYNLTVKIIII